MNSSGINPDVLRPQVRDGGVDVVHLDADVVDAARRVLLEKAGDGRLVPERVQQLDLDYGEERFTLKYGGRQFYMKML